MTNSTNGKVAACAGGGGGSYLFMKYDVFRENAAIIKECSASFLIDSITGQYTDSFSLPISNKMIFPLSIKSYAIIIASR